MGQSSTPCFQRILNISLRWGSNGLMTATVLCVRHNDNPDRLNGRESLGGLLNGSNLASPPASHGPYKDILVLNVEALMVAQFEHT